MFCVLGAFWNHFEFEKESGSSFRRTKSHPAIGRLGGYRSAKSTAVERTAGDTTGRERCEDSASV